MGKIVFEQNQKAVFFLEPEAYPGVKRVAGKVAGDFTRVCGAETEIRECIPDGGTVIFAATAGNSSLLEQMEKEGKICLEKIRGKWEMFQILIVEHPFASVENALVVIGSDKRGTIYGLFQLSELIGVTPFLYFGDSNPQVYDRIVFGKKETEHTSADHG